MSFWDKEIAVAPPYKIYFEGVMELGRQYLYIGTKKGLGLSLVLHLG